MSVNNYCDDDCLYLTQLDGNWFNVIKEVDSLFLQIDL